MSRERFDPEFLEYIASLKKTDDRTLIAEICSYLNFRDRFGILTHTEEHRLSCRCVEALRRGLRLTDEETEL